ncbi:hypothetical protein ACOMHN_028337 [Nucella lapillus]
MNTELDAQPSYEEINKAIKQMITGKAPGPDAIPAEDILGPGRLGEGREWARLPGDLEGGPDGMDLDAEGNLLVAHWGSGHIEVFGPQGGPPQQRVVCPFSRPSNLHFGPGSCKVYVTEHDSHGLWSFTWTTRGMPQYCDRH